jgi:hypothetical protein
MTQSDPLTLIRQRKAALAAKRAEDDAKRAALEAEAAARAKEEEEIAIAERVYERLAKEAAAEQPTEIGEVEVIDRALVSSTSATERLATLRERLRVEARNPPKIPAVGGTPRPEGIPTVPQMVTLLLREAENAGQLGLTSAEIMQGIDREWWPGVSVNMVMPTVYRCISRKYWFEKQDKLIRRLRGGQPKRRDMSELLVS